MIFPLSHPKPDIEELKNIILRKKISTRVHFIEFHIDTELSGISQ